MLREQNCNHMSIFFRNWLEEGYYIEDEMGDLTKTDDPREIKRASDAGNLYHHDGYGMSKGDIDYQTLKNLEDEKGDS